MVYTYKDVITDPNSKQAIACIGKEVYYDNDPKRCLNYANDKNMYFLNTLLGIYPDNERPFLISEGEIVGLGKISFSYSCIIPRKEDEELEELRSSIYDSDIMSEKEETPEYIPFESADEFLNAYENSKYNVINVTTEKKLINCGGIWLKSKCEAIWITQCIEVAANGIVLGLSHEFKFWKELLDGYRFLDDTPCGKNKE